MCLALYEKMNNPAYIVFLVIAAAIGVYTAWKIPIYGQPFVGCEGYSFFSINPHCGIWPESARTALLAAPTSLLIRSVRVLVSYCIIAFILGCFGGLVGIKVGDHLPIFTDPTGVALYNNLYWQAIPTVCGIIVLCLGYGVNRAFLKKSV
jgi:hypothetical protein